MCAAGEFGESKWAPMAPSSTPSLRRSSTLNSWRRVAERLAGGGGTKEKAWALRVLSLRRLCETVNPSAIFQHGWQS